MKYRRLTNGELTELESEFVRFLSSQAIAGTEWEEIKSNKPEVAEDLINIFSDMVLDNIIDRIEYLELRSAKDYKTLHCTKDKMTMLGILIEGESELDFNQTESPQEMLRQLQQSNAKLKMYRGEKAYKVERNLELFGWLEKGAVISKDGNMYKTLKGLL